MSVVDNQLLGLLEQHLQSMPLDVSIEQKAMLVKFVQLMDKWNKAYNLTSVRDPKEMIIKHILDSIVVSPYLDQQRYIDVGTGPGLPGIPLAILNPDKQFVLLDSLGKRVRFMKQAGHELGLKNIQPVQSRVEQYQPELPLDGVLSRAFASLKDMLHWCQHLVDSQGTFLALKGQLPENEISTLPEAFSVSEIVELHVPSLEGERHLLKIIKNEK